MLDVDTAQSTGIGTRYRSVVSFADTDPGSDGRVAAAMAVAAAEDAHLTVLALRYQPDLASYPFGDAGVGVIAKFFDENHRDAERAAAAAEASIAAAGLRGEALPCVTVFSNVEHQVNAVARFADLAVLNPPYGAGTPRTTADLLEAVLYECDIPALIMPEGAPAPDTARVLIGWDGSRQALRAVRGAMPYLRRAGLVEICMVDPLAERPGERLAVMLSRHGVKAEITVLARPVGSISQEIMRHARETGAGLVVMGAYGHSRFRESVLGGVTRDTLEVVPLPLLVAH
ncbi:MAG: universal stress protein [Pseudomonadota bacterium]